MDFIERIDQVYQEFAQTITGMQLPDYLDILLVTYLIYRIMPFLRTRNVSRIVRTVVIFVLVAWATDAMRLHTLSWILNQFLAIGLLAFVVLFQPELRKMLDHLADVKLSRLFSGAKPIQEIDKVITQTVAACETMSKQHVGALIVFSREHRLDEYYKSGTDIDALVSSQLFRNLFFVNSPLHDGAVIVQGGRVAAAGCILPLSKNEAINHLGTRHHAAVGISEVSDAVAVVVSEETGTISVAVGGLLKRHLAPQTLEKLLYMELAPKSEEQERSGMSGLFKEIFRKDKEEEDDGKK